MNTALLLIDIQNDYFPGGAMELIGAEEAGEAAARLLAAARAAGRPVFHVQHIAAQPGATFFLPDTPGARIREIVAPAPGEPVIVKHFPNSFRGTGLEALLRERGVERLVMAGMMTHMCMDAGIRAAADLGFTCVAARDAMATRDLGFDGVDAPAAQVQAAFLAAWHGTYARVETTRQIIVEMF